MINKILETIQEQIDTAITAEHTLLRDALNHIFWDDANQDHLVPTALIDDLISLVTNPVDYGDCYLIDTGKSDKLKTAFRSALREHKNNI